ncbi:hypothetical protein WHT83_14970 [Aminobacter sp. P9b]|uniref:hypothetical protein n=1 Tax=Aminobacter sp. P9b TaxID=3133697 RepID=UPI00324681F3
MKYKNGTAAIDVSVELLREALVLFPSTYRVIGSSCSLAPRTVRLIVESEDIAGHDLLMTCEVKDTGSTRTVVMLPCGRTERP